MLAAVWTVGMLGTATSVMAQESMGCAFGASVLPEPIPVDPAEMTRAVPLEGEAPFTIVLNAGPGLTGNPAALAAFRRAAARWEAVIRDPITVTIDADFAAIEGGVLGQTVPVRLSFDLDLTLSLLSRDASDEVADAIVASLPLGSELDVALPGAAVNGSLMVIDKANLKALGFDADAVFGPTDGRIELNTAFTSSFDFDRSDGVSFSQLDFEGIVVHEIGHLLGFTSGLERVTRLNDVATGSGLPPSPLAAAPEPLDLFRFASGVAELVDGPDGFRLAQRSLVAGGAAVFDDSVHEIRLSTGRLGDGREGSHWKDDSIIGITLGVMDPTLERGQRIDISATDLRALDLIGWEIQSAEARPSVRVQGPMLAASGAPVRLQSTSSDGDGLGFPVFEAFGALNRVALVWDFQGGTPDDPLGVFAPNPTVRFTLPPGSPTTLLRPSLTVFDFLGDSSVGAVDVMVSEPPRIQLTANGDSAARVAVPMNSTVSLRAVATDSDGLGFPVFAAFGSNNPITYFWDFGGGVGQGPLAVFSDAPQVRFSGQAGNAFPVSVTAFDSLGLSTTRTVTISLTNETVNVPPSVFITANDARLTPGSGAGSVGLTVRSGVPVRFMASATDPDGLGFPVFAAFGSNSLISFLWDFGGGVPDGELQIFSASPRVTFTGPPGAQFPVTLIVFDRLGASTTRNLTVTLAP